MGAAPFLRLAVGAPEFGNMGICYTLAVFSPLVRILRRNHDADRRKMLKSLHGHETGPQATDLDENF